MRNNKSRVELPRGFFGIGAYHIKTEVNLGTLMRSAFQLGADFVYTIGRRYKRQASDTVNVGLHVPVYHYENWFDFAAHMPLDCQIVGVEMGGESLVGFKHPERAVYVLGAEDSGLPDDVQDRCHAVVELPSVRMESYNVSVAGSIVMFDRLSKILRSE